MAERKVLLIDDDDALLPMLKTAFSKYKFEVLTTSDGAEGLEIAREKKPDLVLLSVELPVGNGFLVCKEFKLDGELKDIPIIITSRKATDADFEKHRKLKVRANDYLHKPFSDEELFQKVGNVVGFTLSPDEYTELEAKVHDFLEERGKLESEIRDKTDRIAELEGELQEAASNKGASAKVEKELRAKDARIEALESELEGLRESSSEAESLQEKISEIEQQAAQRELELGNEMSQLKKQTERLSKQIASLVEEKDAAEKEASDSKAQISQMESDFGLPVDELAENIKTWREAAESVGDLEASGERLTSELAALKSELAELKDEMSTLTDEAEELRKAAERDTRKRQKLKEALEKAIGALD